MNIKKIVISSVVLLMIDLIYLKNIGAPIFGKVVNDIQGSELKLNFLGAFISYLFLIIAINYFILIPKKSILDAFILGLCIYAVFDGTNLAIFKDYSVKAAIIDSLWGGILFAITTYITLRLTDLQK
jgi:uncharacterized membrane protein